jgi:hypothetical protein
MDLKSIASLGPIHQAVVVTYLRLSGHALGLLINFNVPVLIDGVRRFIISRDTRQVALNAEIAERTEKRPH